MIFIKKYVNLLLSFIKYMPYRFIHSIAASVSIKSSGKNVLLLKLDEIGDYILFRNFLPQIKNAEMVKGSKLILCGNTTWRQLAEHYDRQDVDEFIWIDKKKFSTDYLYRFRTIRRINSLDINTVINYSHSRNFYLDDALVNASRAPLKYGDAGDLSNSYKWQKKRSDNYYSKLINTDSERFEFNKNKLFWELLSGHNSDITKPALNGPLKTTLELPQNYIIISLGGRFKHKRWSMYKFAEVAEYLAPHFSIVLSGSKDDIKFIRAFQNKFSQFYNFIGKTSLIELAAMVKMSRLVISNDTGIIHLAAALNKKSIIIHNGTHYGRFIPYPKEMKIPQIVLHPPEINNVPEEERSKIFYYRSGLDINDINTETVIKAVEKLI